MAMNERPSVNILDNGGKTWEYTYEKFYLKAYLPASKIDGSVNNYTFRAPLLLIFEEKRNTMEEAVAFADKSGLADIASSVDSSVLFVYPTCEGGWKNAGTDLYAAVISEVKMTPDYADGIAEVRAFFSNELKGNFIRGAIFRADIYSYGDSADYVAQNLLKTIEGEYLWGPGEITPAMCSMERLSVKPVVERNEIGILSVGNSDEINEGFALCENLLVKDAANYKEDFKNFVRSFKMWCGKMETEPDFEAMNMTEEAGCTIVHTSADNKYYKNETTHKIGYFAYYNKDLFDKGPAPLLVGFHGAGDSSMYLTFVAEWYEIAHIYGFMFVSLDNHQKVTATETVELIEDIKRQYNIDEHRIYATGFSMGSCKTWEMFEEYPEVFAAVAPTSALFPVGNNPLAMSNSGRFNENTILPIFYSGGEKSHLTELAFQGAAGLERIKYAAGVNRVKKAFDKTFEEKENWEDPIWSVKGDRVEILHDDSRNSDLTIHYFDSDDGICRTAFASVSGQVHECRHHSCETAWKFISQFTR